MDKKEVLGLRKNVERAYPSISAYVPCFNNEASVLGAVESIRRQSVPVDDVFVVDDGSQDGSAAKLEAAGVRVIRLERNQGRSAVRARAMIEARHDWVLVLAGLRIERENDYENEERERLKCTVVSGRSNPMN